MENIAAAGPGAADDARIVAARALVPLARAMRDQVKQQADSISRVERRFGSPEIMHIARLLDDIWLACDGLVADLEDGGVAG